MKQEKQLERSKLFLNMVVHDLRNPAESIQQGLALGKEMLNEDINILIEETNEALNKVIDATSFEGSSFTSQRLLTPSHSFKFVRTLTGPELKMGEQYSELDSLKLQLESFIEQQTELNSGSQLSKISE